MEFFERYRLDLIVYPSYRSKYRIDRDGPYREPLSFAGKPVTFPLLDIEFYYHLGIGRIQGRQVKIRIDYLKIGRRLDITGRDLALAALVRFLELLVNVHSVGPPPHYDATGARVQHPVRAVRSEPAHELIRPYSAGPPAPQCPLPPGGLET